MQQIDQTLARRVGDFVKVTRTDGREHVGTLAETGDLANPYKVLSGRRGRPPVFHADDVKKIVKAKKEADA